MMVVASTIFIDSAQVRVMNKYSSKNIIEQLLSDLKQESQIVNAIIRGCIELRWAVGKEEKETAETMIYNAFEEYAVTRGIPQKVAEEFCEQHLEELIQSVLAILSPEL